MESQIIIHLPKPLQYTFFNTWESDRKETVILRGWAHFFGSNAIK